VSATGGLWRTRKCHKGGIRRIRWDRWGWEFRGESRAVNIAASVDVCQTSEMSGGGFGVLGKRSKLLMGIKYLASPHEILAVVNFRDDDRGMMQHPIATSKNMRIVQNLVSSK